jgi:hypothetical protein
MKQYVHYDYYQYLRSLPGDRINIYKNTPLHIIIKKSDMINKPFIF